MKLFVGALTLVMALVISGVAGFFSVVGLGHLFAGAFWPVVVMGTALETGKIVASSWLKANWSNPRVGRLHKLYLVLAVIVLMAITALGVYGYLAKGHLEQEAPLASIELQIGQIKAQVAQAESERGRLETRLTGLDQAVNALLSNAKTSKETQAADRARQAQRKDRLDLGKQIAAKNAEINGLNESLVPLKLKVSDVSAKLGPVKYVAQLFGWQDPNTAVQLVIVMIMFAFDPLALVLVLSGFVTISEWLKERAARREKAERQQVLAAIADEAPAINRAMEEFVAPPREDLDKVLPYRLPGDATFVRRTLGEAKEQARRSQAAFAASVVRSPEDRLEDLFRAQQEELARAANIAPGDDALDPLFLTQQLALANDETARLSHEKFLLETEVDRMRDEASENLGKHFARAQENRDLKDEVARLRAAPPRPVQAVVPAVFGTVIPTGKGPIKPTAVFGETGRTASIAGLDGSTVRVSLPIFESTPSIFTTTPANSAYPFLQTLVTSDDAEKLTETPGNKDNTVGMEGFNTFVEGHLNSNTK